MGNKTIAVFSIISIRIEIYAQSKGISDQTVTNASDVPALSRTQSDSVTDERTQIIGKRYDTDH
jgi:hypothetical protein